MAFGAYRVILTEASDTKQMVISIDICMSLTIINIYQIFIGILW